MWKLQREKKDQEGSSEMWMSDAKKIPQRQK